MRITLASATASSPKQTPEGLVRLHLPSGVRGRLHLGLKLWARILRVHAPEPNSVLCPLCRSVVLRCEGPAKPEPGTDAGPSDNPFNSGHARYINTVHDTYCRLYLYCLLLYRYLEFSYILIRIICSPFTFMVNFSNRTISKIVIMLQPFKEGINCFTNS